MVNPFRTLISQLISRRPVARRRALSRLSSEALEPRVVFSASAPSVTNVKGICSINGTDQNDSINISQSQKDLNLLVTINGSTTVVEGVVRGFKISGLRGDDDINNETNMPDTILGGDGNDQLSGGDGASEIDGGLGDDYITGGGGKDQLSGGDGKDSIYGNNGDDTLDGGTGNDVLYGEVGNDKINGNQNSDTLFGGLGNDTLLGDAGQDFLYGEAGNDNLKGGSGNDELDGGEGKDNLCGDLGNDRLWGRDGADTLIGGDGSDTLSGGNGDDYLDGDDSYLGGSGYGVDVITTGSGRDIVLYVVSDTITDGSRLDTFLDVFPNDPTWFDPAWYD